MRGVVLSVDLISALQTSFARPGVRVAASAGLNYIDLNGKWSVTNSSGHSYAATVPGQIHTDLLAAGVIGDPYYRFNDVDYQWIALANWTYSRTFTVEPSFLTYDNVRHLRCAYTPFLPLPACLICSLDLCISFL